MNTSTIHKGYPGFVPPLWTNPYHEIECAMRTGKKIQVKKNSRVDKWYDTNSTAVNRDFKPSQYRIVE